MLGFAASKPVPRKTQRGYQEGGSQDEGGDYA